MKVKLVAVHLLAAFAIIGGFACGEASPGGDGGQSNVGLDATSLPVDADVALDGSLSGDAAVTDAVLPLSDAGLEDSGEMVRRDADSVPDVEVIDAEIGDAGSDAALPHDSGAAPDAQQTTDAQMPDAEVPDAEVPDAEVPDADVPTDAKVSSDAETSMDAETSFDAEVPIDAFVPMDDAAVSPDADVPDTGTNIDAEVADSSTPDAHIPDAQVPDASVPDASARACGSTPHGATEARACYAAATVPFGQTCTSFEQSRTCIDGTYQPDFPACAALSCTVDPPASCGATPHGSFETRDCFSAIEVAHPGVCSATQQSRQCFNGSYAPDWPVCAAPSCSVYCPPGFDGDGCAPCPEGTSGYACRFRRYGSIAPEPVVVDRVFDVMWRGCPSGRTGANCEVGGEQRIRWSAAGTYCDQSWGGFDDWRLPRLDDLLELRSGHIGYASQTSIPSLDVVAFPNGDNSFWSSRTQNASGLEAAVVSISGSVSNAGYFYQSVNQTYSAQCARTVLRTMLTSKPPAYATNSDASFTFLSDADPLSTFECRLDGATFAPCTSPALESNLPDGSHRFEVRAIDRFGLVDPTPANWTWTVDASPPETSLVSAPPTVFSGSYFDISFSANEAATFECRLDAGAWSVCTSPYRYFGLIDGNRTFEVRAKDQAGQTDSTPATVSFLSERCGNGSVGPSELCDDGDTQAGDYCASDCRAITGTCGDGVVQANESCEMDRSCTELSLAYTEGTATCGSCQAQITSCTRRPLFNTAGVTEVLGAPDPWTVRIADATGDASPDIVVVSDGDHRLHVLENNMNGSGWIDRVASSNVGAARALDVGDLDGDLDPDIIVPDYSNNAIHWMELQGQSWMLRSLASSISVSKAVTVADFSGDGHLDVAGTGRLGTELAWFENSGSTIFTRHTIAAGTPTAVAAALIDGDGSVDLVASVDRKTWVYRNSGDGQSWTPFFVADLELADLALVDINQDGDLDIVGVTYKTTATGQLLWLDNVLGDGSYWVQRTVVSNLAFSYDVAVADFDLDGDIDLACSSQTAIKWFENLGGASSWATASIYQVSGYQRFDVGDVDGDGDADVAATSSFSDRIQLIENQLIP